MTLWGDPTKGPYGGIQKFPPGFSAPLHTHSSDMHAVVISGTFLVGPEGGPDNKLPAGSFFSFTGKKQHVTKCEGNAECLLAVDSRGKWDVIPEETKPAAKKDGAKPAAKK